MKTIKNITIVATALLFLSGCAEHLEFTNQNNVELVGFWHGLWHGMILPISWIVSLFDSDTAIYAVYNNGGWYDFGFMTGIGLLTSSTGSKIEYKYK